MSVAINRVDVEPDATTPRTLSLVPPCTASAPGTPVHMRRTKRIFDIICSCAALLVLSPVLLAIALAVFISDPGPVLFRQVRIGADGRAFRILKFRSMRSDAEEVLYSDPYLFRRYLENNHKLDPSDDPRITGVGRFLRRSSFDELPQFWNVLTGDMSIVGPRPVLPDELERNYGDARSSYLSARPGITGAWQVSGRSNLDYAQRVALDQRYVDEWSLGRDLEILIRTPRAVLACDGAY